MTRWERAPAHLALVPGVGRPTTEPRVPGGSRVARNRRTSASPGPHPGNPPRPQYPLRYRKWRGGRWGARRGNGREERDVGHAQPGGEPSAAHLDGLLTRAQNGFEIADAQVERLRGALMHQSELRSCRQCNGRSASVGCNTYRHVFLLPDGSSELLWELEHNTTPAAKPCPPAAPGAPCAERAAPGQRRIDAGQAGAGEAAGPPAGPGDGPHGDPVGTRQVSYEVYADERALEIAERRVHERIGGALWDELDSVPFWLPEQLRTSVDPFAPRRTYAVDDSADHARRVLRRAENPDRPGDDVRARADHRVRSRHRARDQAPAAHRRPRHHLVPVLRARVPAGRWGRGVAVGAGAQPDAGRPAGVRGVPGRGGGRVRRRPPRPRPGRRAVTRAGRPRPSRPAAGHRPSPPPGRPPHGGSAYARLAASGSLARRAGPRLGRTHPAGRCAGCGPAESGSDAWGVLGGPVRARSRREPRGPGASPVGCPRSCWSAVSSSTS